MMTIRMFLKTMALFCFAAILAGCVGTVDGGKKMGNPMVTDKITSTYEAPVTMDIAFQAAKKVLATMGNLYGENTITLSLQGKVDTSTVYVKVDDAEGNVRVTTQVRTKGGGTNIPLASEIDKRIALQMTVDINEVVE
ncbi:MAG: hypothetical protein ACOX2U_05600 [Limisphaerales bacterium]|jgi:hypothetical protein|nr:hypothetical protein [Verrucomicrobiota bacterium]